MSRPIFMIICLLILWLATACLGDFSEQFEQAEQLRGQGRLGEAETEYRQILAEAAVSDDGHFSSI